MKVEAPEHPAGEAGTSGTPGGRPFNEELLIKEAKRRHRRRLAPAGYMRPGARWPDRHWGSSPLVNSDDAPHRPPPPVCTQPPPATSLPSTPAVPASDPTCTTPQLAIDYRGLGAGTANCLATSQLLILRPRRPLFAQASRSSSLTRKETSASHRRRCPRTLRSRPTRPCHRLGRTHLLMSSLGSSCWDIPPYRTPSSSSPVVVWAVSVPNRSSHPT